MRIGGKSFPFPPYILEFEDLIFRDDNNAREKKSTEVTNIHRRLITLKKAHRIRWWYDFFPLLFRP